MLTSDPRVLVPHIVRHAEVFVVKALISHAMETGLRRDDNGAVIPRKLINAFTCRFAGVEVFRADFHESVAANPYVEFYLQATESGVLEFIWTEDGGDSVRLAQSVTVGAP